MEVKQASKEVKESENVAEKYSAMTVSKNSEVSMGDLSPAFTALPTHKPGKKVRVRPSPRNTAHWRKLYSLKNVEFYQLSIWRTAFDIADCQRTACDQMYPRLCFLHK